METNIPVVLHPIRLSRLGTDRYELEVVDDQGAHQVLVCTPVEGKVKYIHVDPSPVMRMANDPRPIMAAVMAFHRACVDSDIASR
jgi:hypothetical protein